MSHPEYIERGFEKQLFHLMEECGELISASAKAKRFGLYSVNPLLDPDKQEKNIDWLRREMKDVKEAIERLENTMKEAEY